MDKAGIDHQVVGGWLDSFGYELPAAQGAAWSRYLNDCQWEQFRDERRFSALATVPLQDGKLAAEVLAEAIERGFAGVMVGTLPKGEHGGNLDDPSLDPFWETAARLGAAVVMHPMFVCGEPRLADYDLVNAIGRLVDSTIAVSRLLFSGHLLKHTGMKFVLCHGGAALPFGLGRLARSHTAQAGKVADPRKGFATMYFDSCVFDTDSLDYLVQKAGVERVMLGSDAPFPIGDPEPLKVFNGAKLSDAQRKAILSETAQKIFRLRADAWTRS
jgi:aminocarboxymuconate-semialdehyde decarboxylase